MHDAARCARCARVVPWFSFWGNLGLGIYKLVVGLLGNSAALVADAVHSFTDVLGSTGIVVATKISSRRPDARYPYGRGKAEFVGAVFVYTILLCVSVAIISASLRALLNRELHRPHVVTALGALVSVVHNYLMYRYETCVGRRNNSPAIMADAFENRADAISSTAAIVGIVAAMFLHPACDGFAAIAVGMIIFYNCVEQLAQASRGLMDSGLGVAQTEQIRRVLLEYPEVMAARFIRSRQTGVRYWLDVGIELRSELRFEQADLVVASIRDRLGRHPQCHYVDVYVFPPNPAASTTTTIARLQPRSSPV